MYRWHGPEHSPHFLVLAPGDQGRLEDTAPTAIADGLGEAGVRVVRFPFPPCDAEDGATRDGLLATQIREASSLRGPTQRLILAGLSRGARVSASLAGALGAAGVVGFAYPFHPRHDPDPGTRVEDLIQVPVPMLICQGTRDSHGNAQQIRGYRLPPQLQLHWLEDANHALHPRPRSGQTQAPQLAEAVGVVVTFIERLG